MIKVMDLLSGWSLQRDEVRPSLVHSDGRRLDLSDPAQAPNAEGLSCADELYVALKMEHDRRQREHADAERTPDSMAIWTAYAVIGYFRRQKRKDRRLIEQKTKRQAFEVGDEAGVYDLDGNQVEGLLPPIEEDEEPEPFLDEELERMTKAQQLERARFWQKSAI